MLALLTDPYDFYQASTLDCPRVRNQICHITLPDIMQPLNEPLVLRTIHPVKEVDILYVLTRCGPPKRTNPVPLHVHQESFDPMQVLPGPSYALIEMLRVAHLIADDIFLSLQQGDVYNTSSSKRKIISLSVVRSSSSCNCHYTFVPA